MNEQKHTSIDVSGIQMLKKEMKSLYLQSLNICSIATILALIMLLLAHKLMGSTINPYETQFVSIIGVSITLTRALYIKTVVIPTVLSGGTLL